MRQFLIIVVMMIFTGHLGEAQVGIGTLNPDPSAMMDIRPTGNNKGLLIPRVTLSEKNQITDPATGLLLFQTDGTSGFYYFNGSSWKFINPNVTDGATGPAGGGLADLSEDSSPQLAGDLDVVTFDIVTTSNRDIELAPNGTGKTVLKGNTNPGTLVFNCESNSHGQTVKSQPHSASVTNVLTLPPGGDQEIVGASATQTLTNKTINVSQLTGTYTAAQVPKTETATISTSKTLDFDTNQNFILTLGSGANTLANPTTEAGNVGQTGVMIFIQPSSGSAGTVSLGTDYESVGGGGLTLSSANNAYDVVPYVIKADNSILLGTPQLAFS